jgi:hypothetical protein
LSAYAGPGLDYFILGKSVIAFLIDVVDSLKKFNDFFRNKFVRSSQNNEMVDWFDVGSGTHGM